MPTTDDATIRAETIRRLEQAMGALGSAATARMEERLPWFRTLSAENRSWVGLVAQAGIAAFVEWFKHEEKTRPAIAGEVFGTAPREIMREVTLPQTVEMVRVVIDEVESRVSELAAPSGETQLRESLLRYTREVAFGAAQVYARQAEARGAWDARLEALIVDALLRGEIEDGLHSWVAALGWAAAPVFVLAGHTPEYEPDTLIHDIRTAARRARLDVLVGVQGSRLIVVTGGATDAMAAARTLAAKFGPGPVVTGPQAPDLFQATASARAALAGLRAVPAWPDAPRPVSACDLMPERALDGDMDARRHLVENVYIPLRDAGAPLIDTLTTYLEEGSSLEATARLLFVHPNTVRYRLRRIAELTGYAPTVGRGAFTLRIALVLGRFASRPRSF